MKTAIRVMLILLYSMLLTDMLTACNIYDPVNDTWYQPAKVDKCRAACEDAADFGQCIKHCP